jgi:hypothetical protein
MAEHPSFQSPFLPPGEPVLGKTYRADGWAYIDPPTRFSPEAWDGLMDLIGEGNVVILAATTGTLKDGRPYVRGQLLISPDGIRNIEARRAQPEPAPV